MLLPSQKPCSYLLLKLVQVTRHIRQSLVLYCGAPPPKKNHGSAPLASLCLSTESISKAITVARRGLFGSKKKEKKWRRFGYPHNSKPYSIAALLYLSPTTLCY